MKILYLDCFSGISGDMTIGALLDAGASFAHLKNELKKLYIEEEYQLTTTKVIKNGIKSTKFNVTLTEKHVGHDEKSHHTHKLEHKKSHEKPHEHRTYSDIVKLIDAAKFQPRVKDMALKMFKVIGAAEGKIHGLPLEEIHFHEVGAVDSIIDIVGTAILINQLEIDVIKSSAIPTGSGTIEIAHGIYPVPAPATLEILKQIPLKKTKLKSELTTPTGAAIVAVLVEEFCEFPSMKVKEIGYGAGTKTFTKQPNVLRVVLGE